MKSKVKQSIWYQRLKSESPNFFNRLRKIFLWLATFAGGAFTAYYLIPEEFRHYVPEWVMRTATITVFTASLVGAGIATLTTTDPNLSKK